MNSAFDYKGHKVQPVKLATGKYELLIDGKIQFDGIPTMKFRDAASARQQAKQLIDAEAGR